MQGWLRLAHLIDTANEAIGRTAAWLVAVMVALGALNAVARYASRGLGRNLASNALLEAQWYLFGLVLLLGAAYTLRHDRHVRVDVFLSRLGERGCAWVDLLGTVIFLLPFCVVLIVLTWPTVVNSWHTLEVSPDPGGLPRYPLKTMFLVGFVLLFLQGVAMLIRQIAFLRGHAATRRAPQPDGSRPGEGI